MKNFKKGVVRNMSTWLDKLIKKTTKFTEKGSKDIQKEYRVIDLETASGQNAAIVPYNEIGFYIDSVAAGDEDFVILKSSEGFLQFYGVDDSFIAEMRINYANRDFRTFSFINREKENALERIVLETPYGRYTPMERDVLSYEQIKDIVRNYYICPTSDEFLKKTDWVETTAETKKYMGL